MPAKIKLRDGQCYLYKGRNTMPLDQIVHVNSAISIYFEMSSVCSIEIYELEYMGIKRACTGYAYLLVSRNALTPNGSVSYTLLIPYGTKMRQWDQEKALSMLAAFSNDPLIRCTMRAARADRGKSQQEAA